MGQWELPRWDSLGPSSSSQALLGPCTYRPVYTGHGASRKEAGHSTGHIDVITQDVFPPVISEFEQLVCVCGHTWREEARMAGGQWTGHRESLVLSLGICYKEAGAEGVLWLKAGRLSGGKAPF